jgi:hypothetical protein
LAEISSAAMPRARSALRIRASPGGKRNSAQGVHQPGAGGRIRTGTVNPLDRDLPALDGAGGLLIGGAVDLEHDNGPVGIGQ